MRVGEFCNHEVIVISGDASVKVAAELMRQQHVGAVVPVEPRAAPRVPVGLLTEMLGRVAGGVELQRARESRRRP